MRTEASKQALTQGPIRRSLIFFALPIFLSNLFQQLYNSADSIIVGQFLGKQALAAVSSSGSLIFMLVGFFNGTAVGAGVAYKVCAAIGLVSLICAIFSVRTKKTAPKTKEA